MLNVCITEWWCEPAPPPPPGEPRVECGRPFGVEGKFLKTISQIYNINIGNNATSWKTVPVPAITANYSLNQDIGRRWLDQAEDEHASIASFARHTLQLISIGAPSMLLLGVQNAAIDEVRHAKTCYGIASAFIGSDFKPSSLDVEKSLGKLDLQKITQSLIEEGCIEETISAVLGKFGSSTAQDPAIKAASSQIALEEANHAQLAWDTIQWITKKLSDSRSFIEETFRTEIETRLEAITNTLAFGATNACVESDVDSMIRECGLIVDKDRTKIRQAAMQRIISPLVDAGLKNVELVSTRITQLDLSQI